MFLPGSRKTLKRKPLKRLLSAVDGVVALAIVVVVTAALVLSLIALPGWALMLLCGALYSEFGWLAPIGFVPAWGISFCFSLVFGAFRRSASE